MSFKITKNTFDSWFSSPRMLALLIFLIGLSVKDFLPLRAACKGLGYRVSIGYFALYLGSSMYKQILLCIVLLFANAPFLTDLTPYEQIRTSRRAYFLAKVVYVFLASILFVLSLFLLSQLILFPYVTYMPEWGKIINTLASSRLFAQYPVSWMAYQEVVLNRLSVGEALVAACSMTVLQGVFMGSLMQCIALFRPKSKNAHNLFAMAYIFIPDIAKAFGTTSDLKYLPSSWMRLGILNLNRSAGAATIDIPTALLVLMIFSVGAFIVSYFLWLRTDPYNFMRETK